MDCRKARYCLVVSFDGSLPEGDLRELSYHLRDCRACRHESFYYRELFSIEKQLPACQPCYNFNERLLAEIRLREARAAWPVPETPRRSFRWPWVYVPALFGAAAVAGFLAFLPEAPTPTPLVESAPVVSEAPAAHAEFERPRYVPVPRSGRLPSSRMIFEWPPADPSVGPSADPFRPVLVSSARSYLDTRRPRSTEQYVLPVFTRTVENDRIY